MNECLYVFYDVFFMMCFLCFLFVSLCFIFVSLCFILVFLCFLIVSLRSHYHSYSYSHSSHNIICRSITNGLKDSPFWVYSSQAGVFPTSHLLKIVSLRALLVLFPLRLGLEVINPIYGNFIRGALRSNLSLGIVGGLPSKSLYFVGYQDWDLLFLDPHILKPAADTDLFNNSDDDEELAVDGLIQDFHTDRVRSIPLDQVDPSMLFGFLCCSAEEVVQLRDQLEKLNRHANILTIK